MMLRTPILTLAALALLSSAARAADLFVNPRPPAPIYHEGWIDLNKNGAKDPYENPAVDVESRITDLLARMTPDEKTAQMVTLYGYPRILKDELPTPAWKQAFWKDGIANIDEQGTGYAPPSAGAVKFAHDLPYSRHTRALNEVQRFFIEDTRLGIPVDFSGEGIRGLLHTQATSFPAQTAIGSTWNRELVQEIGRVTGREARALGYTNIYSPVLDLARDPRWGRVIECYGEDPFLVGALGVAQVRGIQENRVVSTLKHFAVYSIPKGGRDGDARTDPQTTWREVETMYLHPFREAVRKGGALGVMSSYNDYDGIPVQSSRRFLIDILRREWGFKGYVVSDSGAVEFVHQKHRVAPTYEEAVKQVVEAGLNVRTHVSGQPEQFATPLRAVVGDGRLAMETVDARVRDTLRVKYWLGLFDQPYRTDFAAADQVARSPEHTAIAARAARESLVLLKNERAALPLRKGVKKVLVAGPLADHGEAWYSRYGPQRLEYVSVLAGIRRKLGSGAEVRFAEGCAVADGFPESDVYKEPPAEKIRAGIAAAAEAAKGMDVAIVVLGETDQLCSESHSRLSLNLPGYQEELLQAIHATGTPTVLVLTNGRALSINWAAKHVPAILETWFQGETGGDAIADALFGDYNPAGRLPVTFPKSVGQVPYNFPTKPAAQARDPGMVQGALFPFGHGLSYTKFGYANLKLSVDRAPTDATVEVSCDVTNRGARAGDEVVQLYVRDDYSSVTTYEKALRGFTRVHLAPGETKTVRFTLAPEHLALLDREGQWTVEPGRFTVMIGASSEDIRLRDNFTLTRADGTAPEEAPIRDTPLPDPV